MQEVRILKNISLQCTLLHTCNFITLNLIHGSKFQCLFWWRTMFRLSHCKISPVCLALTTVSWDELHIYHKQGRLRARWAIAPRPLSVKGPQKGGKSEKNIVWKSIIKGLRGPQNVLAQCPEGPQKYISPRPRRPLIRPWQCIMRIVCGIFMIVGTEKKLWAGRMTCWAPARNGG